MLAMINGWTCVQALNTVFPSCCVLQMASTGGQSLSLSSNVPLLNYQPGLYQQATINIPGLAQQGVPLQTRPTQLCAQTEPFQQTLIVCPPTIQGENEIKNKSQLPCVDLYISYVLLCMYCFFFFSF